MTDVIQPAAIACGLAAAVGIVGMPHGGLDHLFGRAMLVPHVGRWWRPAFAALYLGVAAVVVIGWITAPFVTLISFFLISAFHFGDADGRRGFSGILEGGMVIWVPLLTRPGEVSELSAWVIPNGDVVAIVDFFRDAAWPLCILAAVFANHLGWMMFRGEWWTAARLVLFAAAFAMLPVLVGFGLFFCGWHSTRELVELARRADPEKPWRGLRTVVALAAPRAAVVVAVSAFAAWWFAGDRDLTPVVVQAVFLGLSAVAVPHILLHVVSERVGADPFPRLNEVPS